MKKQSKFKSHLRPMKYQLMLLAMTVCLLLIGYTSVNAMSLEKNILLHKPYIIKEYKVDRAGQTITVKLNPCKNEKCDLILNLNKNGKVLDSRKLEWPLSHYQPESTTAKSPAVSIQDNSTSSNISSFNLSIDGHEENLMKLELAVLKLKDSKFSILIRQIAGFESIGENHHLYSIKGEQLKELFSSPANTAMQQSSKVEVVDIDNDGYDNIVVIKEWDFGGDPELGGDKKHFEIYPPPITFKIYAVLLAASPDINYILKIKRGLEKKYSCLKYKTLLLKTSNYELLKPNLYFLGDVELSKQKAESLLQQYKGCADVNDAYIKRAQ